jgi:hypothetical protein
MTIAGITVGCTLGAVLDSTKFAPNDIIAKLMRDATNECLMPSKQSQAQGQAEEKGHLASMIEKAGLSGLPRFDFKNMGNTPVAAGGGGIGQAPSGHTR